MIKKLRYFIFLHHPFTILFQSVILSLPVQLCTLKYIYVYWFFC